MMMMIPQKIRSILVLFGVGACTSNFLKSIVAILLCSQQNTAVIWYVPILTANVVV